MGSAHSVIAWLVAATVAVACGGTSSNGLLGGRERIPDGGNVCATGTERCPCYGNDTCNAGLTCASSLCVRLPKPGANGSTDAGSDASNPGSGATDASGGETETGGVRGSGGARPGAGGASAAGGKRAAGGSVSSGGGAAGLGGSGNGGAAGSGTGGSGGTLGNGGSSESGGTCPGGQKFCGGLCTPPAPRVGCDLTGCEPCTLTAPANGYVTCLSGECVFDCLSGYKKNVDKCESNGTGVGGSVGNCNPTSCPSCSVVTGPACCTSAGKCGCPMVPWVAQTCL